MKTLKDYSDDELEQLLRLEHCENKVSLRAIAKKLDTYPVKLLRFCNKRNIPVLTKSESLKAAYDSDRLKPARKGIKLTEEERLHLSVRQRETWDGVSPEERERRAQTQREIFEKREDKDRFVLQGNQAIRQAAKYGSKAEHALAAKFKEHNIDFRHHYKEFLGNTQLEVDFYLPEYNCVVEIDGPSHFSATLGVDNYRGQMEADAHKNREVLKMGASIVRLQHRRTLYKLDHHNMFKALMEVLPTLSNELRIIDVEAIK